MSPIPADPVKPDINASLSSESDIYSESWASLCVTK